MLVTVLSNLLNVKSIDTVKVKQRELPWKGKVTLQANTAHYNADGELVFNVVCNAKSPEQGRMISSANVVSLRREPMQDSHHFSVPYGGMLANSPLLRPHKNARILAQNAGRLR